MRQIRLKEWPPHTRKTMAPALDLIKNSDGSLSEEPISVSVCADGFIIDPSRPEEYTSRTIVMGDSVVECTFLQEGTRMTDHCERQLRALGQKHRVENAGRSGATTLHSLTTLQAKIVPMRPDRIVLMNGIIDADALLNKSSFWSKGPYFNPLDEKVDTENAGRSETLDFPMRLRLLNLFLSTCRLFKIHFAMATIPLRGDDEYSRRYMEKHGSRDIRLQATNESTREFCRKNGVPLIDLDEAMGGSTDYFYDYFHFNAAGAERAGRLMAQKLDRLDVLEMHG